MASIPGLFRRGGSYYIRIVLPNDHPLKTQYRNGLNRPGYRGGQLV